MEFLDDRAGFSEATDYEDVMWMYSWWERAELAGDLVPARPEDIPRGH